MKIIIPFFIALFFCSNAWAQNVGIGTTTPAARLHVMDSSVVFSAAGSAPVTQGNPPLQGPGRRMMWYPDKAAFRVGYVSGTQWDKDNIGNYSFATGSITTASGIQSTAMGFGTDATGTNSTAMGGNTTASGHSSTAMGASTEAAGASSTAMGTGTISRGYAGTVIGLNNDPILTDPEASLSGSSPLFIIGNGFTNNNRSNAMVVFYNGRVGFGTSTPSEKLHIDGGNALFNNSSNTTLQLQAAGVDKGFVQLSGNNLRIGTNSSNATANFVVRTNGNDQLGIFPSGNATLAGTLTQTSDARFKQNIQPLSNSLNKLMQISGYQYSWKPELKKDPRMQIGLIAQNVEAVYPELVFNDSNGMKSLAYQNFVPVLVEALKDQQVIIQKQQSTIEDLIKRIEKIESKHP
jgi:Chaperone of endosialidase/Head domain of trimeric autotransporter adhesin